MHENEKPIQKNTTIQIPTLCVNGKDLSFVDEMVAGGISGDDCRDVCFDDNCYCRQYHSLAEVLSQPVKHTLTEEDVKVLCSIGSGANIGTVFSFPLYIISKKL